MELGSLESTLVRLFETPGVAFVAVFAAVGIGAAHAVAPGHGKSITAAYLLAGRARRRDAAFLGGAVAVMHTLSVVVLAVGWITLATVSTIATDRITSWLQIVSAVVVTLVGGVLVQRRAGGHAGHGHGHHHDHGHGHHHDHGHGHHRDHAPHARGPAVSRRMLLAIAVSGGLLPSPSAFLVLVTGVLSGRTWFASVLVLAFAAGLAGTLTAVGVATIRGRDLLLGREAARGRSDALRTWTPLAGAVGVLLVGVVYLAGSVRALIG